MSAKPEAHGVPVILDTDIGGDIDDTWALALLLKSPELDLRLVVSATADTDYRARIAARLLEIAGRTDVPVGVGVRQPSDGPRERQIEWVRDYPLTRYAGRVAEDGVAAMIEAIMASPTPVTLIAIGPVTNIAEALRREPAIAARTRLVAMAGSLAVHHTTNLERSVVPGQIAEWNVVKDIAAARQVFAAPWREAVLTPLDTCAYIVIDGERYGRLLRSNDRLLAAVLENYRIWHTHCPASRPATQTTVLYDAVAVHLAHTTRFLNMVPMRLAVDERGFTLPVADGRPFQVAVSWTDQDGFEEALTARLLDQARP